MFVWVQNIICMDLQAEWCRFKGSEGPVLCLLHEGALTCYEMGGQTESVAMPSSVKSIWPLPQGLLLLVRCFASCTCI